MTSSHPLTTDTRAVTFQVSHLLMMSMTAVLIGGVIMHTSTFVEDTQKDAIRQELTVLGERLGAQLMSADRLAQNGANTSLSIEAGLPARVAGSTYTVALITGSTPSETQLILTTASPDVTVTIPLRNETTFTANRVSGGQAVIQRVNGSITLTQGGDS